MLQRGGGLARCLAALCARDVAGSLVGQRGLAAAPGERVPTASRRNQRSCAAPRTLFPLLGCFSVCGPPIRRTDEPPPPLRLPPPPPPQT